MTNLTIVIPAKYESESLPIVLDQFIGKNYDVCVVLEKSDTETINSIRNKNCRIVYQSKKGFGNALNEGINNSQTEYFCIFNADGSMEINEIDLMLEKISNSNCDIIFASRYEKNSKSDDDTIVTWVGNKVFTLIGKIFFSLNITDILYTFVLGKTQKVKDLKLNQDDFRFCVELPIKAKKKNYNLCTMTAHEKKRIAGKKKVNAIKDGFLILSHMLYLFFN
tara:strand:- start:2233 stop:2898 length:666 start_codon:yes stop_codon:yes gene_type:complete